MRHSVTRALTALALGTAVSLMPAAARGEVIDRILAVVNRELITLSDVAAAIRLGLVSVPQQGSDPTRAVLDALIDRQLELGEANRYQPPEPAESQIQARMEAVRSRFSTPAAFAQALANSGVSEDQLMLRLREDLRIEAYLNQRFGVPRPAVRSGAHRLLSCAHGGLLDRSGRQAFRGGSRADPCAPLRSPAREPGGGLAHESEAAHGNCRSVCQ